jgi:hypothetical protein
MHGVNIKFSCHFAEGTLNIVNVEFGNSGASEDVAWSSATQGALKRRVHTTFCLHPSLYDGGCGGAVC